MPCHNYEKQKATDWDVRKNKLEKLCDKYRGSNGNKYDCAIAVSGGKDSHYQVWYMKEIMRMNPVLISVGNGGNWTKTGSSNVQNIADTFSCDIISLNPNPSVTRKMVLKTFKEIGSPTWYADALIYAFPYRMTIKLGLKLLVYGENVNYTYGGKYDQETPSAKLQPLNDVVKPIWDSHRNYELAKRFGFRHLGHEYIREGTLEQYNQIDSIGYLLNQYLKYPKFGHASATEMASRWIRADLVTREEMIPLVKEKDKKLDQGIVDAFLSFTGIKPREFYSIMDKWYNLDLFYQDEWGIWHERFDVGIGIVR